MDKEIYKMDIISTFLNGVLEVGIYMEQQDLFV